MAVYQTERFSYGYPGDLHHAVAGLAPYATYQVRLHFVETYWTSPGERAFNVAIQGTPVLTNVDKVAAAGGPLRAVVRPFIAVSDGVGRVDLHFTQGSPPGVDGNPTVSGVEVLMQ